MPKIEGYESYVSRIEKKYGPDSPAVLFRREFKLEKGKVLVERTTMQVPHADGEISPAGLCVMNDRNVVVSAHEFIIGEVVLVTRGAPFVYIGKQMIDGVEVVFLVVDQKDIYAKRLVE